jgi:hypothetical protein
MICSEASSPLRCDGEVGWVDGRRRFKLGAARKSIVRAGRSSTGDLFGSSHVDGTREIE